MIYLRVKNKNMKWIISNRKEIIIKTFGVFLLAVGVAGLILPIIPGIGFIFLGLGYFGNSRARLVETIGKFFIVK